MLEARMDGIWTDIFVLRKGRWLAVSSQSTKRIAEQGEEVLARVGARGVAMHHGVMLAAR